MSRWPADLEHKHPSRRCYIKHGCHCDGCREENNQYNRDRRARLRQQAIERGYFTDKPHKHPSANCYKYHGCKCFGCRKANSDKYNEYIRNKRDKEIPNVLLSPEVERIRRLVGI